MVPVDILTVDLLREHQRGQDAERAAWGKASRYRGLVFCREDRRPLRPEYVTRHIQALARKPACRPFGYTTSGTTNASIALAAGVDIKVVSDRLGHSTTAITADLYTHVVPSLGRDAEKGIAGLLADGSQEDPTRCPRARPDKGRKGWAMMYPRR